MPNYNFTQDLVIASKTEQEIGALLEQKGHKILEYNKDKYYDLKVQTKNNKIVTIEIKEDFTCEKTGNVGVEFHCRGKNSGINITTANFYIYKIHEPNGTTNYYLLPTTVLKNLIKEQQYHRIVNGGDPGSNSMNYLFKLSLFQKHSTIITPICT